MSPIAKQLIHKLFFSVVFIFFITSCHKSTSDLNEYGKEVESVILTENGAFRGFSLGDKIDTIQKKEISQPLETDEGYLYYEYKIDSSNSFNISYSFDENGLNEIQSDIYIRNPNNTEAIFNSFKSFFDDHYGSSQQRQGYTVWSVRSEKYGNVKINLSDESGDFTVADSPGKISLWIYPDKE